MGTNDMNDSQQHLKSLFLQIWQWVELENYQEIDSLLNLSQPPSQTEVDMVALLRYTYSVRHHLTGYHIYLDAVAQELLRRGKDVEKILQGLPFYSIDRYP